MSVVLDNIRRILCYVRDDVPKSMASMHADSSVSGIKKAEYLHFLLDNVKKSILHVIFFILPQLSRSNAYRRNMSRYLQTMLDDLNITLLRYHKGYLQSGMYKNYHLSPRLHYHIETFTRYSGIRDGGCEIPAKIQELKAANCSEDFHKCGVCWDPIGPDSSLAILSDCEHTLCEKCAEVLFTGRQSRFVKSY